MTVTGTEETPTGEEAPPAGETGTGETGAGETGTEGAGETGGAAETGTGGGDTAPAGPQLSAVAICDVFNAYPRPTSVRFVQNGGEYKCVTCYGVR